jgi:hypothetical protein
VKIVSFGLRNRTNGCSSNGQDLRSEGIQIMSTLSYSNRKLDFASISGLKSKENKKENKAGIKQSGSADKFHWDGGEYAGKNGYDS